MEDEFFHYEQTRNGWVAVFQKLQKEAKENAGSQDDARKPMNMIRNRYRDVLPIDKTRVKLDNEDNDYINANLVTVEDVKRSYILTQGPLQHTCSHFWQMIWEQNTTGILMLNRCYERGMAKCYPYWPQTDDEGVEFGQWRIELLTTEDADSYRLSHLKLINTSNDESRVILHFHYTRWPDFGVPKTPDVFLEFLYAVRNSGVLNEDVGPCIVHCSAGIGRSGTFCLVDICLKKIEEVNEINGVSVQSRLQDMRTQRLGLIQTPDQLRFSYIAVLQGAIQLLHLVNSDSEEEDEREEEEKQDKEVKAAESDDSEDETQGSSNGFKMTNGPAISIYGEHDDDDDKPPPIPPRPPDTLPSYHQEMLRHSPSPPSSTSPSPPPPPPPTSLPPGPPVVHTHTNSSDDENQTKRPHLDEDSDDEDDDIEEVLMRHGTRATEETVEHEETMIEERLADAPAVPLHDREDSREEEKSGEDSFLMQGGGERENNSPLPPPLPPKMYRRDPPPGIDDRPPLPLPVEAQLQDKKEEQALINELTELEALVSPPTAVSFATEEVAATTTEVAAAPPVEEENIRKNDEPSSSPTSDDDIQLSIQRRRDQRAERGRRIAEQVKEMKRKTTEKTDPPPSVPWLLVTLSLVVGYILYHVWNT